MKNVPLFAAGDRRLTRVARVVLGLSFGAGCRLDAQGAGHLPGGGPALIAVNHKSDLDPIFVGLSFPRQLRYLAKAELFRKRTVAWAVTELGAIPLNRGAGDRAAIETALACLGRGEALIMFPEGTRFPDDEVHGFQAGIGLLALRSGAPVIPAALKGSGEVLRSGRVGLPRVRLRAGAPVDLGGLAGKRSAMYAAAAQRIEAAVKDLYERI